MSILGALVAFALACWVLGWMLIGVLWLEVRLSDLFKSIFGRK